MTMTGLFLFLGGTFAGVALARYVLKDADLGTPPTREQRLAQATATTCIILSVLVNAIGVGRAIIQNNWTSASVRAGVLVFVAALWIATVWMRRYLEAQYAALRAQAAMIDEMRESRARMELDAFGDDTGVAKH